MSKYSPAHFREVPSNRYERSKSLETSAVVWASLHYIEEALHPPWVLQGSPTDLVPVHPPKTAQLIAALFYVLD